jgi:hypothetical protein
MSLKPAERLGAISEYYFSRKLEEIRLMNEAGRDVINLGIGSPDLEPSTATRKAAQIAIDQPGTHGYASYRSSPQLRQAIAKWTDATYGVKADATREVLPLLGSKEGLFYLAMAYLNPGDQALVPNPGYPAYASVTRLAGGEVLNYDLKENSKWWPDFEELGARDLSRVKLMFVNYPHMPTGQSASPELFEKLIAFGREKGILIVHDNPYGLVLNETEPLSLLRFDPRKEVSLELNSMSKAFNMAGWRVGWIIAHPEVIDTVLKVKSNVDSGMFLAVQAGAIEAFQNPASWHEERNRVYRERRALVYQLFDRLGFRYSRDQVGLFTWAKAPDSITDVAGFLDQVLEQHAVFFTPGFIFGSQGARYARSSLCVPVERLNEALKRLEKAK